MALAVLGALGVTGALLQVLLDRLLPSTESFLDRFEVKGLNHELLEELHIELLAVSTVLNDAEEKRDMNRVVKHWLDELQSAAYDAEDLLDEILMVLQPQNEEGSAQEVSKHYVSSFNARLTKILKKLEHLVRQKDRIGLKEKGLGAKRPSSMSNIPTTSLIDESEIYGRDKDKKELLSLLLSDNEVDGNEVPVIAITGMPGVGKTTLAQLLYNDETVRSHFNIRTWAHVAEEFDVLRITKGVYESMLTKSLNIGAGNLDMLQLRLKEKVSGHRFLIVLDDVWNEDFNTWNLLQKPFRAGAKGSKIIVTTRSQNVSLTMRAFHCHNMLPLSDPYAWFLFASHAFGVKNKISLQDRNLEMIGREIVRKCCGLPLALKLLGSILRFKDEADEWRYVLNSEFWDLPGNNILPALKLSYFGLSAPLKTCFAYCSLFPKDHKFDKEGLVQLWMAQGLLHQSKFKWRIEQVGNQHFQELASKSFFLKSSGSSVYFMHHLVNDLARHVGGEFHFCCTDADLSTSFKRVRYLSYVHGKSNSPCKLHSFIGAPLRSFIALQGTKLSKGDATATDFYHFLSTQPNLRVLSLSGFQGITMLPDSIGKLKHLRYLDISGKHIESLPETVCSLRKLQTLLLKNCKFLKALPRGAYKLINLRNLDITGAPIEAMPPHFSCLTSLQSLSMFVVNALRGSRITELKKLRDLRGKLAITGLNNVTNASEASEAGLENKQYLSELELHWDNSTGHSEKGSTSGSFDNLEQLSDNYTCEVQSCVLDQLRPHKNLKKVSIRNYSGVSFPGWLADNSLPNLVTLCISNCRQCSSLPPLGQLSSLKELIVANMEQIEVLGPEFYGNSMMTFPALEVLQFTNMPKWVIWSEARENTFPSLRKIHVEKCPELIGIIPMHLRSLEMVKIHDCKKLELTFSTFYVKVAVKELDIKSSCYSLESFPLSSFETLERLAIHGCNSLKTICISDELQTALKNLRAIKITSCLKLEGFQGEMNAPSLTWFSLSNCPRFEAMPGKMQISLRSLESLNVSCCSRLTAFPDGGLPSSLQNLSIEDCDGLTPNKEWRLSDMKVLESLEIRGGCNDMVSFPEEGLLPDSLSQLHISEIPNLRSLNDIGLQSLTRLQTLSITSCDNMQCISSQRLPGSISSLSVTDCPYLNERCKVGGADWHKISRIPSIHIPDEE